MKLLEQFIANIILDLLITTCYVLLPVVFITTFILDGLLITLASLTALLRFAFYATLFRCVRWVFVPTVLLGLTSIHWIKSLGIDVFNGTRPYWTTFCAKLDAIGRITLDLKVFHVSVGKMWKYITDYNKSFARVVVDNPSEELSDIARVTRVRTKEEDRLHRYIDDLEAFENSSLLETMTMEQAILLILTRTAATHQKRVVHYRLSEEHGPSQPAQLGQHHEYLHEIMRPHTHYDKLHTSEVNLFRPDEPDCAICFSPLLVGEVMVTHETCRRTFHLTCFNFALLRDRICPFDRQRLSQHLTSPQNLNPDATINPTPNEAAEHRDTENLHNTQPLGQRHIGIATQDDGYIPILRGNGLAETGERQLILPQMVQIEAIQEAEIPVIQQAIRPADNIPRRNYRPRQWRPTRAWR